MTVILAQQQRTYVLLGYIPSMEGRIEENKML
jgi:hypothetical protein